MKVMQWMIAAMMLLLSGNSAHASQRSTPAALFVEPLTGMEFVRVKGGCYQMGDFAGKGFPEERPLHEVCVSDFYIGKKEVSQKQWKSVMGDNPSRFKGNDDCPVENVSWKDVQKYLEKLGGATGKKFRLPTEAEWEYAARGAGLDCQFSGTDSAKLLGDYAWYIGNSNRNTQCVGSRKPNELGLHDMSGNVWEWVADNYDENYYKRSPRDNPQGPSTGDFKVMRGGSWYQDPFWMRLTLRFRDNPNNRDDEYGFRLVYCPD